ncbi:MAG: hypothetical protein AB1726_03305 [Planctomycetota bacterium]
MKRLGILLLLAAFSIPVWSDVITGSGGDDWLYGTEGGDTIRGMGGNDHIYGHGGDDKLAGGSGADVIDGGTKNNSSNPDGDDTFWDGDMPADEASPGSSDGAADEIDARDGSDGDTINAGPEDTVRANAGDTVRIRDQRGGVVFSGTYTQYLDWKKSQPRE